jgi:hypothetical protein
MFKTYTRKGPEIEAMKFIWNATTNADVEEWLGDPFVVRYSSVQPGVVIEQPGKADVMVNAGEYVGKDSNGNVFKMTDQLLACFYDEVVE